MLLHTILGDQEHMATSNAASELLKLVQQLQDERAAHVKAIETIDQTFKELCDNHPPEDPPTDEQISEWEARMGPTAGGGSIQGGWAGPRSVPLRAEGVRRA